MASYSQWAARREIKRVLWVCGTEQVLAEEVIAAARAQATERETLVAGEDSERDIWSACMQHPADPDVRRVVVIRNAERLRGVLDGVPALVAATDLGAVTVVFHAGEDDFPEVTDEAGVTARPAHIASLRDSRAGQLIRCAPPAPDAEWHLQWASDRLGGAGTLLGAYLLERCGDDMTEAAAAADKLRLAEIPVTRESIDLVAQGTSSFAEAVLRGKRPAALSAAAGLSNDEVGRAIYHLDGRLRLLADLHSAAAQRLDARDASRKLGIRAHTRRQLGDLAERYGPERIASCRSVLAIADAAWRSGVTEGIPEVIAVLWAA